MSTPLDTYLAGAVPGARPVVVALDDAVLAAHPGFDVAIRYGILMYALDGDWRAWVCAVQAARRTVCLRFLYGVLLDDPREVLRAGSSVLKTWDFGFDDVVDAGAVGAYVSEAVRRHPDYVAHSAEILAASRKAAGARRRRDR